MERTKQLLFDRLYFIGGDQRLLNQATQQGVLLTPFDLARIVERAPGVDVNLNEIAWAVGLFANDAAGRKRAKEKLVDFRRGPFAFKPTWRTFVSALREELFYIGLLAVILVLWIFSTIYTGSSMLAQVEDRIREEVQLALPEESIPYRREKEFLDERIGALETKLQELGSLSALSPLDSLKELSLAIPKNIDITIDDLQIREQGLSLGGSVPDIPAVGRLSTALEARKERFCKVTIDSKGKLAGSSRVKFTVDIGLCE